MTESAWRCGVTRPAMGILAALGLIVTAGAGLAQTTRPAAATAPASQPATAISAVVADIQGQASYAVLQPDGTYGAKQPLKKGDRLSGGTKIQTRLRSFVVLTFGDNTVVKIDPLTEASVDQFVRSGEDQNVVLGLGHGMVRAGSVAPTLRSEMAIVTPTATLTKRGTFEFGLRYEAGSGRYFAYLTEEGLVNVMNHTTGIRRTLEPTQYVTQAMVRWIETAVFSRWVSVQDLFGLTGSEIAFNSHWNTGQGAASPGGGSTANLTSGRNSRTIIGGTPAGFVPNIAQEGSGAVGRPEGNFGARR